MIDKNDPVNHPAHYTKGTIEALDAIASALSGSEFVGYSRGKSLNTCGVPRIRTKRLRIIRRRGFIWTC